MVLATNLALATEADLHLVHGLAAAVFANALAHCSEVSVVAVARPEVALVTDHLLQIASGPSLVVSRSS
jgi:hypothetical protein